jgi:hypothetical protein
MPIVVAAVLTMSAAQLLDLVTFMNMVKTVGPVAEANPLVATLFGAYGFPMVAIAKVVLLALTTGVAAVLLRPPRHSRLLATVFAVAIVVGLVGGVSNAIAVDAFSGALEHVGRLGGP